MNYFAKNIRFLRKHRGMSQQQMADALSIKRSNIAAYETKNVEPRLSLISTMADMLGVSMSDLICRDIGSEGPSSNGDIGTSFGSAVRDNGLFLGLQEAEQLRKQSMDIQSMLEGFRVFYQYKRDLIKISDDQQRRLIDTDVENFLIFIDHMLGYNNQILQMLDEVDGEQSMEQSAGQAGRAVG